MLQKHKLYALAIAGVLAMGVVACGEDDTSSGGSSGNAASGGDGKTGKVAVLLPD